MADLKISQLNAITVLTPATDVLPVVDSGGVTKKITTNQILGSGGTATLASATITGALGAAGLNVTGATIPANGVYLGSANNLSFSAASTLGMTLNATGLGVGTSPATKLHVSDNTGSPAFRMNGAATANNGPFIEFYKNNVRKMLMGNESLLIGGGSTSDNFGFYNEGAFDFKWYINGTTPKMTLDATGNVGIGVTPSAWGSGRAIEVLEKGYGIWNGTGSSYLLANAYFNSGFKYANTGSQATHYYQYQGTHVWSTAASGTAGNAITFTQAMTLAANGQLLLGTSSTNGAVDIGMVMNKPSAMGFVGNVYQLNSVDKAFTYIASGNSAYNIETVSGYIVRVVSATNGVYLANGGTSWLALSDERFKDIIEPISNAVAKVGSLRSVIGKFKSEAEGTRRSFLIAQDVQAVLPEAVDATKPDQLGVSYSDVIPLLVAAIKELTARVQTLEAK